MSRRPAPPDQAQRDAAVRERARNVLIDAGAGTGKTTLLVERLVAMVAPDGDLPPVPLRRLAAITFTRKAAGELRLRIRERLLRALAVADLPAAREAALRQALADLDTAHVGTIHAFADRLLRLRPVEAQLSPAYEIVEDDADLVAETWERLIHGVQTDTLGAALAGTPAAALAAEATRTLALALGAELRVESVETEHWTLHGLEALVGAFVRARDVAPALPDPTAFDAAAFRAAAGAFVQAARGVSAATPGGRWIAATAERLAAHAGVEEPVVLFREVRRALRRRPRRMRRRHEFGGDETAWKAWKALDRGSPSVLDALRAPLDRWLATRLVRLFPVVVTLYEQVKARRRVLDSLDLLLRLRDLLARERVVRADLQALFDHIFVDEFQDTDPLQVEIVLFLCEQGQAAARWDEVVLRPGALTLVGDPKQSIYRFRRADVATYDRVRQLVARGPHLAVTLSANFRSVPALIPWFNDRFEAILGRSPDGRPFDPATGTVYHQPLAPGRADDGAALPGESPARPGQATAPANNHRTAPPVHVVPAAFDDDRKPTADACRRLEAEALARYLRWLVEASGVEVADPLTGRRRSVRYGDVAVLAIATTSLLPLFARLDVEDIPYTSRGGTLFLADPLVRQFLLGLRAVADRDDGVAEAALLRPPFFALDPADLLRERAARAGAVVEDEAVRRVRQARALVAALRRDRLGRPPGATARDLLERTALGRAVARGPNAAQRLARLREVCLLLERLAAQEGLDYDAATARLRQWALAPVQLDPPLPVGGEAVQVLTVHQAKGLEFPVVVLWDSRAGWDAFLPEPPWRIERDGRGWTISLDGLAWEEPPGLDLRGTERAYRQAERRRLVYVAATRARDLLVISATATPRPGRSIHADLIAEAPVAAVRVLDVYRPGSGAAWSRALPAPARPAPGDAAALFAEVAGRWEAAAREAARPRFRPVGVAEAARGVEGRPSVEDRALAEDRAAGPTAEPALTSRTGRFGPLFGATVHQAIGLLLREPALGPAQAVRIAAARTGLAGTVEGASSQSGPSGPPGEAPPDAASLLAEAAADVARAWQALAAEGLARLPSPDLRLEYPVAGPGPEGTLIAGYADLVAVTGDRVDVLDFKTDPPPPGPVESAYPEYVHQVRLYADLLGSAGLLSGRRLRCGLLFMGAGRIRWMIDPRHE
jgi:ATP-dependent exoDNAse (exonuclease V) beta subunit